MKVTLLNYTPDALTLLLRTKGTRLSHNEDPALWSEEKRQEHLDYMRDTIRSSWEFVDYVFKIEGVTRAFTHQLVRTRTGSYAQQAMRVIDARNHAVAMPPFVGAYAQPYEIWEDAVSGVMDSYAKLIDLGVPAQDARGILPTNIETEIIAKYNLRTLSSMAELRMCTRTQGEYQDVFREMRRLVCEVHPWAEEFINVHCVARGTCAFPRYGKAECPVYPAIQRVEEQIAFARPKVKELFDSIRHEAKPMARDGKAM